MADKYEYNPMEEPGHQAMVMELDAVRQELELLTLAELEDLLWRRLNADDEEATFDIWIMGEQLFERGHWELVFEVGRRVAGRDPAHTGRYLSLLNELWDIVGDGEFEEGGPFDCEGDDK